MKFRQRSYQQGNIQYLTQEELAAFFKVIKRPRDLTLFNMIYKYGLRISEARMLKVYDISLTKNTVRVQRLKGSVSSEYPLHQDTRNLLRKYINTLPQEQVYLFHTIRKKPFTSRGLYQIYQNYYDRSGLSNPQKRHPHCLRHTIAMHALESGRDLLYVQWLLGHKNFDSTLYYVRLTDRKKMFEFAEMNRSPFIVNL